ncbi:Tropinesterase [Thalassocella blandensis]|nr:Tropinesterase [Thalassocella blandensis]
MKHCEFDLGPIKLAGKRWGNPNGIPVIALHGWLDNCASFDFLAPLLPKLDLLTLDLAGQGKSGHRQGFGAYNIWQDVAEVMALANQLDWKKFGIIGHSRGAMISTLIAGTFPERVTHLATIESFIPQVVAADQAAVQLASAVESILTFQGRPKNTYETFANAVEAREKGLLRLCHEDALVLAKRGVEQNAQGRFFWNYDVKLNAPSEVKFTLEQVRSFVDRIKIPVAVVIAEQGLVGDFEHVVNMLDETENVTTYHLPGEHHLHMSHQCESIAEIFNEYFVV